MPVSARLLLVLVHLPTNLTTRALAALFNTSQSAIDRTLHHLVPVLASSLQPDTGQHDGPWIIDGTLIPAHDQSITAPAKNYRRSINTQIIICCRHRCVVTVGQSWPGNRNDVVVARNTVAPLLTGGRMVLGDGGYRGITTISTARRDQSGRTIRDQDCANTVGSGPASNMSSLDSKTGRSCAMPPRRRHQPQPSNHRWTLEPQDPHPITGHLSQAEIPTGKANTSRTDGMQSISFCPRGLPGSAFGACRFAPAVPGR